MRKTTVFLILISIILCGCPREKLQTANAQNSKDNPITDTPKVPERHLASFDIRQLNFPVVEDKVTLSSIQALAIMDMDMPLIFHKQAYGEFPNSISDWVNSGFPLIWPRNILNGSPVRVFNLDNVTPDESLFSSFQYGKIDNKIELKYVGYDREHANQTGKDEWKIHSYIFPNPPLDDFSKIYVNGGKKKFSDINDQQSLKIYLLTAEFFNFLQRHTSYLFSHSNVLPDSFQDLLFAKEYFIKENFNEFRNFTKNSDADLKFGFDYPKKVNYFYLSIDNEVYIFDCITYGTSQTEQFGSSCEKIENLDMSSPLITSENITDLIIPEGYMISIQDLQMSN